MTASQPLFCNQDKLPLAIRQGPYMTPPFHGVVSSAKRVINHVAKRHCNNYQNLQEPTENTCLVDIHSSRNFITTFCFSSGKKSLQLFSFISTSIKG